MLECVSDILGGGKASVHCFALTFICVIALSGWPMVHCQSLSEKTLRAKAQFLTAEVPMSFPERLDRRLYCLV